MQQQQRCAQHNHSTPIIASRFEWCKKKRFEATENSITVCMCAMMIDCITSTPNESAKFITEILPVSNWIMDFVAFHFHLLLFFLFHVHSRSLFYFRFIAVNVTVRMQTSRRRKKWLRLCLRFPTFDRRTSMSVCVLDAEPVYLKACVCVLWNRHK